VDIANAKFFPGNKLEMKPSYVITEFGEKISRANLLGVVTEKFLDEEQSYASITIDDGFSSLRVKAFAEQAKLFESISPGDLILVVGRVKNYNEENYIAAEVVRKVADPNFAILHLAEVLEKLLERKRMRDDLLRVREEVSDEELREYAKEKYAIDEETLRVVLESKKIEADYKPKILDVIEKLDDGSGVEVAKLLQILNLPENVVESAITDLLSSGEIYEPVVGRLKKVG
jgi:RPA family protein